MLHQTKFPNEAQILSQHKPEVKMVQLPSKFKLSPSTVIVIWRKKENFKRK